MEKSKVIKYYYKIITWKEDLDIISMYRNKNDKEWYRNNILHRDNGPAVIDSFSIEWYYNGQLHRDNGPAFETEYWKQWWHHGNFIKQEEVSAENK